MSFLCHHISKLQTKLFFWLIWHKQFPLRYLNIILTKSSSKKAIINLSQSRRQAMKGLTAVCLCVLALESCVYVCVCVWVSCLSQGFCCFSREGISPVPLLFGKVNVRKFLSFTVAIRQLRSCHWKWICVSLTFMAYSHQHNYFGINSALLIPSPQRSQ